MRSCARSISAPTIARSRRSTTSSAVRSLLPSRIATSRSPVIRRKPCAREWPSLRAQAKQSSQRKYLDCFVARAPRNDEGFRRRDRIAMSNIPENSASPVDVAEFIDAQPVGGFQIRLLLTCAAVLFLDGFDTQAIGFVAPALAKEWGVTKVALGPVFSAGLFGLMIGALVFGPVADRLGRKTVIIFSTLAFGLGALATAFAWDLTSLLVLRFLTGLGLGGAMPNAIALTSDFSPKRRRATMVMIMFCGFSIGAALGGLLAADMIPRFGWRAVFIVGGIAPLLMLPILVWRLPESVRFLATFGHAPERVAELLGKISPTTAFA